MSMHLRGSRDMMGKDESWWQSRTGLEQKLVILSTVLFILSFSLTISVIVIKNRSPSAPPAVTTVSPATGTQDTSTASSPTTEESKSTTAPPAVTTASPVTETEDTSTASSQATEESKSTTALSEVPTVSPSTSEPSKPTTGDVIVPSEPTKDEHATSKESPEKEPKKSEEFALGPGSISNRPARYISPRALADLNGA